MKKTLVPFIQRLSEEDKSAWLKALQKEMPNINICFMENLSKKKRESVEVVIIAKNIRTYFDSNKIPPSVSRQVGY